VSTLQVERVDGVPIARARVDIDAANAAAMQEALAGCVGPDGESLILDLGGIRYVDSAGLDMLFRLNERLRERRATLVLVIPESSQLSRLAAIVALPETVAVHGTLEQARRAARPARGESGERAVATAPAPAKPAPAKPAPAEPAPAEPAPAEPAPAERDA
jgi:anti-anti-sigma factor